MGFDARARRYGEAGGEEARRSAARRFYEKRDRWKALVRADASLTHAQRSVAHTLADDFLNRESGTGWPSKATLATRCAVTVSTVTRAIRALEDGRYLEVARAVGRGRSNEYRICFPDNVVPMVPAEPVQTCPEKVAQCSQCGEHLRAASPSPDPFPAPEIDPLEQEVADAEKVAGVRGKGSTRATPYISEPQREPRGGRVIGFPAPTRAGLVPRPFGLRQAGGGVQMPLPLVPHGGAGEVVLHVRTHMQALRAWETWLLGRKDFDLDQFTRRPGGDGTDGYSLPTRFPPATDDPGEVEAMVRRLLALRARLPGSGRGASHDQAGRVGPCPGEGRARIDASTGPSPIPPGAGNSHPDTELA